MAAIPNMPTTIVPRDYVAGALRVAQIDRATAHSVMSAVDRTPGLLDFHRDLGAVAGVRELIAAIQGSSSLSPSDKRRVLDQLRAAASTNAVTVTAAAKSLGLTQPVGSREQLNELRAALQRRDLDVVAHAADDMGAPAVLRVPVSFLDPGGAQATALAQPQNSLVIQPKPLAIAGTTLGTLAIGGAWLFGPEGTADADKPAKARTDGKARQNIWDAAYGYEDAQISDVLADGSLGSEVRAWKQASATGHADDPNAPWQMAFAAQVARDAGLKLGPKGQGAETEIDLRVWAEKSGHFRKAGDEAARRPGNFVLLVRRDQRGLTSHDIGVVMGENTSGTGIVFTAGNRLVGDTATVNGREVYVGRVGHETIGYNDTLANDGWEIEGYIDLVAKPRKVVTTKRIDEPQARREIVQRAKAQVGFKELWGNNNGPKIDQYWDSAGGWDVADEDKAMNAPWCAAFTSWLYNEQRLPYLDRDGDLSTVNTKEWAQRANVWHENVPGSNYTPLPGDLVLFRGSTAYGRGPDGVDHIGIVVSYDATTKTVTTIEGNTGAPGDRDGDGVFRHQFQRFGAKNAYGENYINGFINVFDAYDKRRD